MTLIGSVHEKVSCASIVLLNTQTLQEKDAEVVKPVDVVGFCGFMEKLPRLVHIPMLEAAE